MHRIAALLFILSSASLLPAPALFRYGTDGKGWIFDTVGVGETFTNSSDQAITVTIAATVGTSAPPAPAPSYASVTLPAHGLYYWYTVAVLGGQAWYPTPPVAGLGLGGDLSIPVYLWVRNPAGHWQQASQVNVPFQFAGLGYYGQPWNLGDLACWVELSPYAAVEPKDHQVQGSALTGDPVDTATGHYVRDEPLLTVQGARPIALTGHFSSLEFGSDFDASLTAQQSQGSISSVLIRWPGQRQNVYYPSGQAFYSYELSALHDALSQNADGSYTLTKPDQSQYVFGPAAGPGGALYLRAVVNPIGQRLTLSYPNATASSRGTVVVTEPLSGKTLTLSYDAANRLASAADPLGRQVSLQYTGSMTSPSQIQLLAP